MLVSHRPEALLMLADGTVFRGRAIGATGTTTGEICFNTGMTGYQEIFTDPSYTGQIMTLATPHVGNYGTKDDEGESNKYSIAGLVVKKFSEVWSRPAGSASLQDQLAANGVVGISDVDTRRLVRHIRDHGAQNAIISSAELDPAKLKSILDKAPSMAGLELSSKVSTKEPIDHGSEKGHRVAVIDLGVKQNILRCLTERGCIVRVFPMATSLEQIMEWKPDGILLSNGPGDPSAMGSSLDHVRSIVDSGLPVFGICLGHQLLAESLGIPTEKMHHGHRGINHPVKDLTTGRDEITSQNHGFVVKRSAAEKDPRIEITHVHLNDNSIAGFRMRDRPVFCVQYHPEAGPGPLDSRYLFDRFVGNMNAHSHVERSLHQNA